MCPKIQQRPRSVLEYFVRCQTIYSNVPSNGLKYFVTRAITSITGRAGIYRVLLETGYPRGEGSCSAESHLAIHSGHDQYPPPVTSSFQIMSMSVHFQHVEY